MSRASGSLLQSSSVDGVTHVAVVGAGAAGLVSARELLRVGLTPTVFEASSVAGGLWNYDASAPSPARLTEFDVRRPRSLARSPLYPTLRTNLPRRLMAFRDFPFDDPDDEGRSVEFPRHEAVRRYLARFAEAFELRRFIEFETRVERVEERDDSPGFCVQTTLGTKRFDAVVICNGHYSEPNVPVLAGSAEFPGILLHSYVYRGSAPLAGKRVLLVGAASSGLDLAHELSTVAARVWLSAVDPEEVSVDEPVQAVARVERLHANGSVELADGSIIEAVDVVLYCTGYRYHFPFLPTGWVEVRQGSVSPLYLDLVHVERPRLAFVGLPFKVVPFPQFEIQAKVFASYLRGGLELPGVEERRHSHEEERSESASRGEPERYALRHGARQFDYYNRLARLSDEPALPDWFAPLYDAVSEARREHPRDYRDVMASDLLTER